MLSLAIQVSLKLAMLSKSETPGRRQEKSSKTPASLQDKAVKASGIMRYNISLHITVGAVCPCQR